MRTIFSKPTMCPIDTCSNLMYFMFINIECARINIIMLFAILQPASGCRSYDHNRSTIQYFSFKFAIHS